MSPDEASKLRGLIGDHATEWARAHEKKEAHELLTLQRLDAFIRELTVAPSEERMGISRKTREG